MKKCKKNKPKKRLRRQLHRALREIDTLKFRLNRAESDTANVQAMQPGISSTDKRQRIGLNDLYLFAYPSELRKIEEDVLRCDGIETGGMLFGHITRTGIMCVDMASVASVRAKRDVAMFASDAREDERLANAIIEGYGIEPLGTWHSHHRLGLDYPSAGDIASMRRHFELLPDAIRKFILSIATINSDNQVIVKPYLFIRGSDTPSEMQWMFPEKVENSPFSSILNERKNVL